MTPAAVYTMMGGIDARRRARRRSAPLARDVPSGQARVSFAAAGPRSYAWSPRHTSAAPRAALPARNRARARRPRAHGGARGRLPVLTAERSGRRRRRAGLRKALVLLLLVRHAAARATARVLLHLREREREKERRARARARAARGRARAGERERQRARAGGGVAPLSLERARSASSPGERARAGAPRALRRAARLDLLARVVAHEVEAARRTRRAADAPTKRPRPTKSVNSPTQKSAVCSVVSADA